MHYTLLSDVLRRASDPVYCEMLLLNLCLLTNSLLFDKNPFVLSAYDTSNVVDTGYAKYAGNRTFPTTLAFLGIPYAEPPVGRLRFRAPVPLNSSRVAQQTGGSVVDATKYPDFCIQGTTGGA